MTVRPRRIRIRYDNVGLDDFAIGKPNPSRGSAVKEDLLDLGVVAYFAALEFVETDQTINQLPHTAHRKMHPPASFQKRDQAVDRCDVERVTPDEQRMEAKDKAHARITN